MVAKEVMIEILSPLQTEISVYLTFIILILLFNSVKIDIGTIGDIEKSGFSTYNLSR